MIITSRDNDIIKEVSKLLSSAKYRKEKGAFVSEGVRLCFDGAISGAEITAFLYTAAAKDKYADEFEKISACADKSYEVSDRLFAKISDTKTPQGFLCIFKALDKCDVMFKILEKGHYAALENIQDPSNMGTILRTAEALGVDGVILSFIGSPDWGVIVGNIFAMTWLTNFTAYTEGYKYLCVYTEECRKYK